MGARSLGYWTTKQVLRMSRHYKSFQALGTSCAKAGGGGLGRSGWDNDTIHSVVGMEYWRCVGDVPSQGQLKAGVDLIPG